MTHLRFPGVEHVLLPAHHNGYTSAFSTLRSGQRVTEIQKNMDYLTSVDDASRCMKCGFCMSSCPVYGVDHMESHVARGRNLLIQWANKGEINTEGAYQDALSFCILCGRCEATCPARISSATLTVQARAQLVTQKGLTWTEQLVYRGILKHRSLVARLLGLAAKIPGFSITEGKPLRHLADLASLFSRGLALPRLSSPFFSQRIPRRTLPPFGIQRRGEVAFFPGCGLEFFFADSGKAIAFALAEAGFEVVNPFGQTCCGLAVQSAGDLETATLMARKNIEVLSSFAAIVTGCATCSAALKRYGDLFSPEDPIQKKARELSQKIYDFSEFLVRPGFNSPKTTAFPLRVTYHDPCHLRWHQGIHDAPRKILHALEGVTFIEMEGADTCCGLGGSFGIKHREISLAIQAKKMEAIKKTNAQVVVTSCPGCLIQLMDGVRRHQLPIKVMHIAQLLGGETRGKVK